MAPSQVAAAVAGVQEASRQQSSLVPFFQTSSLVPFLQLSMVWAPAAVTTATDANNIATLLRFFMDVLERCARSLVRWRWIYTIRMTITRNDESIVP